MAGYNDLTGKRFGKLTVIKKLSEKEDRYWLWLCQCDCGRFVTVNTKRLTRGTVRDCGCSSQKTARNGPKAEDLTGQRFGNLVVTRRAKNRNGRTCWYCICDCGNEKVVTAHDLKSGSVKSCGCRKYARGKGIRDIAGEKFGRLTALYPTEKRNEKGSVYWHCRCDCGNEVDVTSDGLLWGSYRSCGCWKEEIKEMIPQRLHHVDGTCVEILANRKSRCDNTSGFRGVYMLKNGKYKACIGFKQKRYWLGTYRTFEEAVQVRLEAEDLIHNGFLEAYYEWKDHADLDPQWGREHPLSFQVEKINGDLVIRK